VTSRTRQLCVSLGLVLLLTGCREELEAGEDFGGGWEVVLGELEAGLIGVWAPADDDVWAVGADPGDGLGGYVYHFDGTDWERIATSTEGNFWWVHGDGTGPVWMVGEGGLVVRWTPEGGPVAIDPPADINLFGAFVLADDDVWVCGGNNLSSSEKQVLWHWNGTGWDEKTDVVALRDTHAVLTKLYARSPDELWVVGGPDEGLYLRDGAWEVIDVATEEPLTSIFGNQDLLIAAGGGNRGLVVENDGSGFVEIELEGAQPLNGIALADDGRAVASGWYGSLHLRDAQGNWSPVDEVEIRHQDFHSTSVTPTGTVYVTGALFGVANIYDGILVRGQLLPAEEDGADE